MKLSKNFSLWEFEKSYTAHRRGIDNTVPTEEIKENLRRLAINILQPIRDHYGASVHINSGYRSKKLNKLVRGAKTSQHQYGFAADISIRNITNPEIAEWIYENLNYDQVILEFYDPQRSQYSGWVHVSYKSKEKNRNQALTVLSKRAGGGTRYGLHP